MSHFFKVLLTFCFLSTAAFANAIVLGEYKGAGKLIVHRADEAGHTSAYENDCTVALNIYLSESSLDLPFGIFKCERGVDVWNEAVISLGLQDGKLFNKAGAQVGEVSEDGTYTFTVGASKISTIRTVHIDHRCQVSRIETRKVKLENNLTYSIKPLSGLNGYVISRTQSQDALKPVYRTEYPNCPAGAFFEKETTTRNIENVTILKK